MAAGGWRGNGDSEKVCCEQSSGWQGGAVGWEGAGPVRDLREPGANSSYRGEGALTG